MANSRIDFTHVKSVQKALLRDWVKALGAPAVVAQPDMLAGQTL